MYIKKTLKVEKEKITGVICDQCGRKEESGIPYDWYLFSSSHQGWGNDSIDSIENHHICSPECFQQALETIIPEQEHYQGAEIGGMERAFAKRLLAYMKKGLK